jgi:large subunit ribosomal protein L17
MHRHGYQGRKFHRERDQREALVQSLAESLVQHGSIETTLPKAKEVVPYVEKLITKAKLGNLHNRRHIISKLQTVSAGHKLVDGLAPKLQARSSGHLRIVRTRLRRGDNAQLARVSFVDDLTPAAPAQTTAPAKQAAGVESPEASAESDSSSTTRSAAAAKEKQS